MHVIQHTKRKGGGVYWTYVLDPGDGAEVVQLLLDHGLKQSKFDKTGQTYYGGDAKTKIAIETADFLKDDSKSEDKMKITEYRHRGSALAYWLIEDCRGMDLVKATDLGFVRLGPASVYSYDEDLVNRYALLIGHHKFKSMAVDDDNDPLGDSEVVDMSKDEAKELTVVELRSKAGEIAKRLGMPTTEIKTRWSKEQLADFVSSDGAKLPQTVGGTSPQPDMAALGAMMAQMIAQFMPAQGLDEDRVREIANEVAGIVPQRVVVVQADKTEIDAGIQHNMFPAICKLIGLRMHVMLVGPAGSGKTTACENAAKACGLEFYCVSVGQQTTKTDFQGFLDAMGKYNATLFRKAFEFGGVFLLDEIDAGNANVLTVLNAALANGVCAFPDGMAKRHPDFVCIAAGNTFGRGADRLYVGRNQLDAASLDRFKVLDFDYDEELEKAISPNSEWTAYVQKIRKGIEKSKERVVCSPRASMDGGTILNAGAFTWKETEEMCIWKGIGQDVRSKILAHC